MKRFAVLAALMAALLAIPAAAMASGGSGGSGGGGGPGYGRPGTVQAVCPVPSRLRTGHPRRTIVIRGRVLPGKAKLPPKALLKLVRQGKKGPRRNRLQVPAGTRRFASARSCGSTWHPAAAR